MPKFEFCLPTLGKNAGPEWLHEIKYEGYRLRVGRDGDRVRLIARVGYDWSTTFTGSARCSRSAISSSAYA